MGSIADLEAVEALFTARTGISVPSARRHVFESAILRAAKVIAPSENDGLCARIVSEDAFVDEIIRELAVGETYFFRDARHFDFVRNHVVRDVFERLGTRHVLRAWSAGCSTGEEPYSLAMTFEEERLAGFTQITATDLSRRALDFARRAVYRPWSFRGEGAERARAYMTECDGHWTLEPRIKRRVDFRQLNLVTDVYPGAGELDVIFCRNVLIYFDRDVIATVARKLVDALSEGGYLIMGPSDPSLLNYVSLEPFVAPEGIFFRRPTNVRSFVPLPVVHEVPLSPAPIVFAPLSVEPKPAPSRIEDATVAFSRGDYAGAAKLASEVAPSVEASLVRVRALANVDLSLAERTCAEALETFPMSAELRYLHATLLVELGRDADAETMLRRAIYLDRMFAVCHGLLGLVLERRGDLPGARRAFRNAQRICLALPADAEIPMSKGERAAAMAQAMTRNVERLEAVDEVSP